MSIRDEARQEAGRQAERQFPELLLAPENEQRADDYCSGFEKGAVWASEQTDREPSDAEVEAAGEAIIEASFGQELPEAPIDLARAALIAAQQVRRG